MSDSEPKPDAPGVPSWQLPHPEEDVAESASASSPTHADIQTETASESRTETSADDGAASSTSEEDRLEVARKFLNDETVRDAPWRQKVAFLKSKDIADEDIQLLLGDEPIASPTSEPSEPTQAPSQSTSTQTSSAPPPQSSSTDRAPIVTYPEFLAKPERPPPLVTKNGLLNTLYAVVGLSTLVYGTTKSVVQPMVEAQTDARTEFYETTAQNLDSLVAKLEKTVSEVPVVKKPAAGANATVEDEDDSEDPAELFHRDMGTQTSFPLGMPASQGDSKNEPTTKRQAEQLASLAKSLSSLKDGARSQSEGLQNVRTLIDGFNDDLDTLTYEGKSVGSFDLYGRASKKEPKDEIRKVKENIRLIKGIMLSTRNFPATQVR
ncbi:peroxisomal membrane anchor protein conserved region-domain-containing protein [Mariannaea sp. PMI_226]|nr:peroxisomal membrane anchor protein conserved region-domain-containing protein [Mariannaea sp. PMI_226]